MSHLLSYINQLSTAFPMPLLALVEKAKGWNLMAADRWMAD